MVGDDEVGRRRLAPGVVQEAVVVERAAHARAVVAFAGYLFPDRRPRHDVEVGPAAVPGLARPAEQRPQLGALVGLDQVLAVTLEVVDLGEADVVVAPLHQDRLELEGKRALEQGEVLVDELLLKVDRVGGDHDASLVGDRPGQGRDQVGQALSGARARLEERELAVVERVADRPEHA